jgi:hypothetical protein
LDINESFPAKEKPVELDRAMPASVKTDFVQAYLYVADLSMSADIVNGQKEVSFTARISAGKYDMEAQLIDQDGRVHPAYYVYVEKL